MILATNMLNAYLSTQTPSFRASMINNTVILAKKPPGWQLNTQSVVAKVSFFLLSITLIYSCIFFTTVHFSDKRDGLVYLPSLLYPSLLVSVIFWHTIPTSLFIFEDFSFCLYTRQLCSGRWCVTVVVDCGFVQCYWDWPQLCWYWNHTVTCLTVCITQYHITCELAVCTILQY